MDKKPSWKLWAVFGLIVGCIAIAVVWQEIETYRIGQETKKMDKKSMDDFERRLRQ